MNGHGVTTKTRARDALTDASFLIKHLIVQMRRKPLPAMPGRAHDGMLLKLAVAVANLDNAIADIRRVYTASDSSRLKKVEEKKVDDRLKARRDAHARKARSDAARISLPASQGLVA